MKDEIEIRIKELEKFEQQTLNNLIACQARLHELKSLLEPKEEIKEEKDE